MTAPDPDTPRPRPAPADENPKGDNNGQTIRYEKSANTPLQALARIAPTLKEGQLKLAIALAALTENNKHHTITIGTRDLCKAANLSESAVPAALRALEERALITIRHGSASRKNAYMVNFLSTASASFAEAPPAPFAEAPLPLFERHPASFREAPPTENKELAGAAAAVDEVPRLTPILDRVLTSKICHHDKSDLARFRSWLHGYMAKLGRDDRNQPLTDPHPPDLEIVAQFLAVAEPRRLETMLDALLIERQPAYSYAWFVTVALQRIHGIAWTETKKARAELRMVKRGKRDAAIAAGTAADPESSQALLSEAILRVKKL